MRQRCIRPLISAVLLATVAGVSLAEPSAEQLYRESRRADKHHSYSGTKVLRRPQEPERRSRRMRVHHRATPHATYIGVLRGEEIVFEILQLGDDRYTKRKGREWGKDSFPRSRNRTELLLKNYRPRRIGESVIAGRRCVGIKLSPVHPGNPTQILWIDKDTRLVIKTEVFDHHGNPTLESRFERISFAPKFTPRCFQPPSRPRVRTRVEVEPDFPILLPANKGVPPGYQRVSRSAFKTSEGQIIAVVRYTDGLNTISLIQSGRALPPPPARGPRGNKPGTKGSPNRGPNRSSRPRIVRRVGATHCVVYGDLDRKLLEKMADSLRPAP